MSSIGAIATPPEEWDRRIINMALEVKGWVKVVDGVGAIVCAPDRRWLSPGYSGFPAGIEDTKPRLMDDDERRRLSSHAELNAIINARADVSGFTLYSTKFPCHECAKAIINSRIRRVVAPRPDAETRWHQSQTDAWKMFREAGVEVSFFELKQEEA